jgi:hypothetical protein
MSLPETLELRDGNAGTWTIEDEGKEKKNNYFCCIIKIKF